MSWVVVDNGREILKADSYAEVLTGAALLIKYALRKQFDKKVPEILIEETVKLELLGKEHYQLSMRDLYWYGSNVMTDWLEAIEAVDRRRNMVVPADKVLGNWLDIRILPYKEQQARTQLSRVS